MLRKIQLLLLASTIFNVYLSADDHRKIELINAVFYEAPIVSANLKKEAAVMYEINSSGSYYIANDLTVKGITAISPTYIKITASNVSVNLNSQAIIYDTTSAQTDCIAIEVASGLSNITIYNGTISGIKGTAIKVGTGCSNVEIKDILIEKCDKVGMTFDTANNVNIENVTIIGCSSASSTTTTAVAANFSTCSNVAIKNSNFNNNIATSVTVDSVTTWEDTIGLYITDSTSVTIKDCNANSNKGGACYGLRLTGSKGCSILNCNFTGNEGTTGIAYGLSLESCKSTRIENCTSQSNSSTGNDAVGFNISDSTGLIFTKAIALNNFTTTAGVNTYGFKLSASPSNQFINSEAIANLSTKLCYGFYLAAASNDNKFQSCSAQYNTSSGAVTAGGSSSYGMYLTSGQGNRIDNCIVNGNYSGTVASSIGCGIAFHLDEKRSMITNSEIFDNSSTAGESYGIKFGSTGETVLNCILKYNKISNNKGGAKSYGFKDFSADMSSLLIANTSFGHGMIFPLVNSAIADSGALNYMFLFTDISEKASSLIKETDISLLDALITANADFSNLSLYSK